MGRKITKDSRDKVGFLIIQSMPGCLERIRLPDMEWLREGNRRNLVASIVSGVLFFFGWWLAIDAAAVYPDKTELKDVFHICGVFATISMAMVNAVSNGQLRGESYTTGCLGNQGARVWFFIGFLLGFGSLIGACWILFGEYLFPNEENTFHPKFMSPGWAIFLQNFLIFVASLIYKFGRSEDLWG